MMTGKQLQVCFPASTANTAKTTLGNTVTHSLFRDLNKNDRIRVLLSIALLKNRDYYFFDDVPAGVQGIPGDNSSDIAGQIKTLLAKPSTIVRLKPGCWPDDGDYHLRVSYLDGKYVCKRFN